MNAPAVKTCAVCDGYTYDADPITLQVAGWNGVRLWLCSPECAWEAGTRTARRCGSELPTLSVLQVLFKSDGIEVLP